MSDKQIAKNEEASLNLTEESAKHNTCCTRGLPMAAYLLAEGRFVCQECAAQYFSNSSYCFKHESLKECDSNFDQTLKICVNCAKESLTDGGAQSKIENLNKVV